MGRKPYRTSSGTSRKRREEPDTQNGHSAPWWDDKCKQAHRELRRCRPGTAEHEAARRNLKTTVRARKRAHWDSIISGATARRNIWTLAKWRKATDSFQPPPLVDGERSITDPVQRATYLRDKLLKRKTTEEDISDPWEGHLSPNPKIEWDTKVTKAEAKKATTGSGNTAPGADGISVALLQLAWPAIEDHVTDLFTASLRLGYYLTPFWSAEVTLIPKPGKPKKACTTHKGYRPISLLSCVGKGLERLLARRVPLLAMEHKILPQQYFGALPRSSSTDLVACLIHDIERALDRGLVVSLLTLDISGALDIVMRNRLVRRLREQGWPVLLIRWV
ncbi:reverse transcriptase [Trichoderma arundinaceum]|uniref:Reverse transcriptase n=1 Tax=Trichoderma arundinaceum TaxID=490622 RepID=A0A395NR32_TRIAR|nr:reverse transcriptase [Trichoderma arundinaceum]